MSNGKEKKGLTIGFVNNGYFKARLVVKENDGKGNSKRTHLHHLENFVTVSDSSVVRVRIQVKKGLKVFVIGGYYYLDNQYEIPKGATGRIDFVVSGTVHYESVEIKKGKDFVCKNGNTVSTRESRKAACSMKQCRIALLAFHENVAKRLRKDQEIWEKEKRGDIEKNIKAHQKKIEQIKSHIEMLVSADIHDDDNKKEEKSSTDDEDDDTQQQQRLKYPRTTTQNLDIAEEMVRRGSVELDAVQEVIRHLESRILHHQNEITELKTKLYFGIMAEKNRNLTFWDFCGGSAGVFFAFRGFHLETLNIGFSIRTHIDKVQIEFTSLKLHSMCHAIRVIAEKGAGIPNLTGDDVTISLDATMKMEMCYQDTTASSTKTFRKLPCEECEEIVDAYSRQCVDCGINLCREHKKVHMSKIRRKMWKCKDQGKCVKRQHLTNQNAEWHTSDDFEFNVSDMQIRGLHVGIPQSLIVWAIKSYLPSTVRNAIQNLVPLEFGEYMRKTTGRVNIVSGEIKLGGAPLNVLNKSFKLGASLRVSDLDNSVVEVKDELSRDALKYLGITSQQGHLLHKLRRRVGLLSLKHFDLWKECSKWSSIQSLVRYESLLSAASKSETPRTRARVVSFWQSAIDYYAHEDGIESPNIEQIFERVSNISRRPLNLSIRLSNLNLELNAKLCLEMIKSILLRSLLGSSVTPGVSASSPIVVHQQRKKSTRRHSVKSSLKAKRMVEIETSVDEWMKDIEDIAHHFFRVASSLRVRVRGGDNAVLDVGCSRILLLLKPEGSLSFQEHLMVPSTEAMSLYVNDDKDLNLDWLILPDEDMTGRSRVSSSVSNFDHVSKVTSGDVLRAFNIKDIIDVRRRSRNLSTEMARIAYGTSKSFPEHERLLLLKLGPTSLGTVIQDIEKLKRFLEERKKASSNDLLRLHLLSQKVRNGSNIKLDCAPGVAAEIMISTIKFVASPYRLCRYLLAQEDEVHGGDEDLKEEEDLDADTATKMKMRNYAMKMVKLTRKLENMGDVMLSQKESVKLLPTSSSCNSERETLNRALQSFAESYVSSSDLCVDIAFRFEAEVSSDSNVCVRLFGEKTSSDVIHYRNVSFARDHIEGIRAILSASSSSGTSS